MPSEKKNLKKEDHMENNLRKFWKANYDYKGILKKPCRQYSYFYIHHVKIESKNFIFNLLSLTR